MKITIDTKEDSHEEIRKIIKMLYSLIGEKETFTNQPNIFEDNNEPSSAFANMFGSAASDEKKENEEINVGEKEDIPEVIEYH